MAGIAQIIREAQEHPQRPIIEGLLNESETAGLHGSPEAFKTIFTLQLAEALANATPFLDVWRVPEPQPVYYFETEMSTTAVGDRLKKMFSGRECPTGISLATEAELRHFRRAPKLEDKFNVLRDLVGEAGATVVIIDTCNPFFRGKESPNDETTAGGFFDLLDTLPAPTKWFVRHNHKPRMAGEAEDGASKIRGSGQFADVPDLLLELQRRNKRTSEAILSLSKFRHGTKHDDLPLWFDIGDFKLISVPPVIHLLRGGALSRQQLLEKMESRFSISQRLADTQIAEQRQYLNERSQGHSRILEICTSAAREAEWRSRIYLPGGGVDNMQGCIIFPPPLETNSSRVPAADAA
jgi:hypothetical protein